MSDDNERVTETNFEEDDDKEIEVSEDVAGDEENNSETVVETSNTETETAPAAVEDEERNVYVSNLSHQVEVEELTACGLLFVIIIVCRFITRLILF